MLTKTKDVALYRPGQDVLCPHPHHVQNDQDEYVLAKCEGCKYADAELNCMGVPAANYNTVMDRHCNCYLIEDTEDEQ